MKKAVITGPTGGVGSALIRELCRQGVEVTAVIRPGSSRADNVRGIPGVTVVECELHELKKLSSLPHDFEAFYHFGWTGTYGASRLDREEQQKNVQYTLDAAELAETLGCSVFVGAGSQSEFGHVEGILSPDLPCHPDNEYGIAKLEAGLKSRALCKEKGIRHVWVRIVSSFGPGDADRTMVMGTLKAFLNGEERQFTKGDQIWDYIYTGDLARIFVLAAEKGRDGAVYVAGTGKTRTLRSYIETMRDIVCPERELSFGGIPYYPNQVMHLEADISNLVEDTGFEPEYSFEEGVRKTVEWIRQQ